MFPTEAAINVALMFLEDYCVDNPHPLLTQAKSHLDQCQNLLKSYYLEFHSLNWNKSRKAVKQEKEAELNAIATQALEYLNQGGQLLNKYSDENQIELNAWSKIIQHLIYCREWIKVDHLKGEPEISPNCSQITKSKPIVKNHFPQQLSFFK